MLVSDQKGDYKLLNDEISIDELLKDYAKITHFNILFNTKASFKIKIFGKREIAKNDLDLFISTMTEASGLSLLKREETKLIEVISQRDVVYRGAKLYKNLDEIKPDYKYYRYLIPLKYAEASVIGRNLRPLVSKYARIIDEKNANNLILIETGKNIHVLTQFIKELDTPEFQKDRKTVQKLNEKASFEIEEKSNFLDILKDQYFLFLLTFSLLGGMIGFGLRGYAIKKSDGWE